MTSCLHIFLLTRIQEKTLAKYRYFLRFHSDSRKVFMNTSEGKWFFYCSDNAAKTSSYGLKISRNTEIKYTYYFKTHFPVTCTFCTSCLIAFRMINASSCYPSDACYLLNPKKAGGKSETLIFCDLILSLATSFLKTSLKFLKSFRRYKGFLLQY